MEILNWQIMATLLTSVIALGGFILSIVNFAYARKRENPKITVVPRIQKVLVTMNTNGIKGPSHESVEIYLDIVNNRNFPVMIRNAGLITSKKKGVKFPALLPDVIIGKSEVTLFWPRSIDALSRLRANVMTTEYISGDFKNVSLAFVELVTGEWFFGESEELTKFIEKIKRGDVPPIGNVYARIGNWQE